MRTSESWKRKKDKPEEKTEISEIDAPAIVGGKLVCRVGELKANSYHFIRGSTYNPQLRPVTL
jgi:hypothetical protein